MKRVFCIGILVCAWIAFGAGTAYSDAPPLADRDCVKCHPAEADEIDARGASHKTEIGCLDCHPQHPPIGQTTVLSCADCHSPQESAHYAVDKCLDCHKPHAPLETDFSKIDSARSACVSCHVEPQEQMKAHPTAHADMDCKECHAQHPQSASCVDCHEPHGNNMTAADCRLCHKPHRPKPLVYDGAVSSRLCSPCHDDVISILDEKGGAHKELECADCHQKHPPDTGVMPECEQCHSREDSPHYAVGQCAGCHKAHSPADTPMNRGEPTKPVCLSCHPEPGKQMQSAPSAHADMDCVECHTRHPESALCTDCHEPHSQTMENADCIRCHKPHIPKEVVYADDTPSDFCTGCHAAEGVKLERTSAKHKDLACVYCHKERHRSVFDCGVCHGEPHDFKLHAKYPKCVTCHKDAHALVR